MNLRQSSCSIIYGIVLAYGVFLSLAGLSIFNSSFWGVNSWTYLSMTVLVLIVAVGCISVWMAIRMPFPASLKARMLIAILAPCIFYLLRDKTHLLGDGRLWISTLTDVRPYHPNEPLAFGWACIITSGLESSPPFKAALRMELSSILLGALGLFLMCSIVIRLVRTDLARWISVGILISSGVVQFAFGYVEAYPLLWTEILLFILWALDFSEGKRSSGWCAWVAGVAIGTHPVAVGLVPGLVVLLVLRARKDGKAFAQAAGALIGLLVPIVFAYWILPIFWHGHSQTHGVPPLFHEILELQSGSTVRWNWLLHEANEWGLIAPLGLSLCLAGVLLLGPWLLKRQGLERFEHSPFLVALAISFSVPILVLNPAASRGEVADWDVFAVASTPVGLLASYVWTPIAEKWRALKFILAIGFLLAFFNTASFISVNAMTTASIRRFKTANTDPKLSPWARGLGFETLGIYYRDGGRLSEAATMYDLAVLAQPKDLRLARNRAGVLSWCGRHRESANAYLKLANEEPGHASTWENLALELEQVGAADSAAAAWRNALKLKPSSVTGMNHLANLLLREPLTRGEAFELLRRSLKIDPEQRLAPQIREILEGSQIP